MRRVSIVTGMKQRLQEILGQSTTSDATGDLIPWSVQAAMLSNFERIVKGIAGNSEGQGRVMKGLIMSFSGVRITISAGIGFTESGKVIVLESPIYYDVTPSPSREIHIYLQHILVAVDGNNVLNPEAKKTSFLDGSASEDIVADDWATSLKSNAQSQANNIIRTADDDLDNNEDDVYLGYVTVNGSVIIGKSDTAKTGF
jgi:hypothetical protein